jgi:hypothetical protein
VGVGAGVGAGDGVDGGEMILALISNHSCTFAVSLPPLLRPQLPLLPG